MSSSLSRIGEVSLGQGERTPHSHPIMMGHEFEERRVAFRSRFRCIHSVCIARTIGEQSVIVNSRVPMGRRGEIGAVSRLSISIDKRRSVWTPMLSPICDRDAFNVTFWHLVTWVRHKLEMNGLARTTDRWSPTARRLAGIHQIHML
jgi:hypothetical protein